MNKRIAALATFAAFALLLMGCAHRVHMMNANFVPAARGSVKVDQDRNGNLVVHVAVKHLSPATGLTPPRSDYVVWLRPQGKPPEAQGQLVVNPSTLEGSFSTTTPYHQFELFITAESSPKPTVPTGPQVLHSTIAR